MVVTEWPQSDIGKCLVLAQYSEARRHLASNPHNVTTYKRFHYTLFSSQSMMEERWKRRTGFSASLDWSRTWPK